MNLGDFRLGDTIDLKFTTRQISGAPFTLAGVPVISAYPANSTTEITAGITLTVDFDARTGLNHVRVVASSGNGYATATSYALVITTGTVNSVSVVGEVVGYFSIENRSALMPAVGGRTLGVEATGKATGVVLTDTLTTYTGDTPQTGDAFARIGALGAGLTSLATQSSVNTLAGYVDTEVAAILAAVDTEVAAIKAKTDALTFTKAGEVDANIQSVNDVTVLGAGTGANKWRA